MAVDLILLFKRKNILSFGAKWLTRHKSLTIEVRILEGWEWIKKNES
jgi:hypothetical protein